MTLKNDIAPLLAKNTQDENAKKLDVLLLAIELSLLDEDASAGKAVQNVQLVAELSYVHHYFVLILGRQP